MFVDANVAVEQDSEGRGRLRAAQCFQNESRHVGLRRRRQPPRSPTRESAIVHFDGDFELRRISSEQLPILGVKIGGFVILLNVIECFPRAVSIGR